MNDILTKNVLLHAATSALIFIIISFIHDGLDTSRGLQSYFVPISVGFIVGAIIGIMKLRLEQKNMKSEEFFMDIIAALSVTLDARDAYTYGHSQRVTAMALQLGTKIGLSFQVLKCIKLCALLHDIGKIGISDSVLFKKSALTGLEFSQKEKHPLIGARILEKMRDSRMVDVVKCVRSHHEKYDGSGYPDGIKGEDIPLTARIINVADSFDAMTTDRPYRKAMDTEAAVTELIKGAGTQFDPELVKAFVELMGDKRHPKECPYLSSCSLFPKIQERELSKAY